MRHDTCMENPRVRVMIIKKKERRHLSASAYFETILSKKELATQPSYRVIVEEGFKPF